MRYLVGEAMTGGYGDADILHDCTIGVDEGEIAVVVGPNGAGKSTAMKAVFGMLGLRSGRVLMNGEDITALKPQERVRKGMGFVPQTNNVFPSLTVIEEPSGHLSLTNETFQKHVQCDAIVQCLGHNLSFKGLFGHPRRLCADTVKRLCDAVTVVAPPNPIKLIVINTEGVERPDGEDRKTLRRGCCESCVLCFLKYCLPPHADNIDTSVYLHNEVQNNPYVDFCAVRPSDLIDGLPTEFTVHETLQNGIFNSVTRKFLFMDTSPSHFTSHEKLKSLPLFVLFPPFEIRPSRLTPSADMPKRKAFVPSLNVSSTRVIESLFLELQSRLRDETTYWSS